VKALEQIEGLQKADFEFNKRQWAALKEVNSVLQPVAEAILLLEGEKYPTISFVLEMRHLLLQHTKKWEVSSNLAHEFKEMLHQELEERFDMDSMPLVVRMATLLDPNTRDAPFLKAATVKDGFKLIKVNMDRLKPVAEVERPPRSEANTELSSLANLRNDMYKDTAKSDELRQYRALPIPHVEPPVDALKWWSAHASTFPLLSVLARKLLGIPASSAPVERLFSTAGNVITKKRQRLAPSATRAQVHKRFFFVDFTLDFLLYIDPDFILENDIGYRKIQPDNWFFSNRYL